MDQIRTILSEADQEEAGLLKRRSEEARASAELTMAVILWGGLLGTLTVVAIGWFITRSLSEQIESARPHGSKLVERVAGGGQSQATGAREQAAAMTEVAPR